MSSSPSASKSEEDNGMKVDGNQNDDTVILTQDDKDGVQTATKDGAVDSEKSPSSTKISTKIIKTEMNQIGNLELLEVKDILLDTVIPQNHPQNPQQQQQQQQYPGAYAVRGINCVPDTTNDHQAIGVNDASDAVDNTSLSNSDTNTDIPTSNTSSMVDSSTVTGTIPSPSQMITAESEVLTSSLQSSEALVLTAIVVDEDETERKRMCLIAETEERVRREISGRGGPIVEAEIVGSSVNEQQDTVGKRRNRNITGIIVALLVIVIVTVVSITLTQNTSDKSSADVNNLEQAVEGFPTEKTNFVEEKLHKWVELNTELQEYLDAIMSTDISKTVSEDCKSEINAYTESAEKSCQLERLYDSPWNYGDMWLASTTTYKLMNDGSDNGAAYLDGHYRLATILDTTVYLSEVFPPPFTCYADCYTGIGNGCETLLSLAPSEYSVNPQNVTTWFVEPESSISPNMYCKVAWGTVDQAYIDLKVCAANSSLNIDSQFISNEAYALSYGFEKKENQKCSENYCGQEVLLQPECGQEKTNDFINGNSWLKEYFDLMFSSDKYKKAAESCKNEIDTFTETADMSCQLEKKFNSSWNYGDRWLATAASYAAMSDGNPNGAVYMDGHYMLAILFDETLNFTIPLMKSHVCLADCYTGMSWNGDNNTCDFLDKPAPEEINPFKLDSLFVSQSTISVDTYCNIEWGSVDQAFIDIKVCAAEAVGDPIMMTHEQYVCFFEYEKARQQQCSEYYCDEDTSDFDITLEDYCQISSEQLDLIYTWSNTTWI